ncbi:hypothetical protein BJ508DRAFT_27689 [Ascobolus immersus RN42]|uniref:Uncharacterized protein n=1 Tax=Ascobolus immersus RN42 TaxID=1160509 RepID=A0A3N4IFC1_ASCIM|nr:hypothetical protein BJ508DRAFT_27689 [Ascobolus immersus RN42]
MSHSDSDDEEDKPWYGELPPAPIAPLNELKLGHVPPFFQTTEFPGIEDGFQMLRPLFDSNGTSSTGPRRRKIIVKRDPKDAATDHYPTAQFFKHDDRILKRERGVKVRFPGDENPHVWKVAFSYAATVNLVRKDLVEKHLLGRTYPIAGDLKFRWTARSVLFHYSVIWDLDSLLELFDPETLDFIAFRTAGMTILGMTILPICFEGKHTLAVPALIFEWTNGAWAKADPAPEIDAVLCRDAFSKTNWNLRMEFTTINWVPRFPVKPTRLRLAKGTLSLTLTADLDLDHCRIFYDDSSALNVTIPVGELYPIADALWTYFKLGKHHHADRKKLRHDSVGRMSLLAITAIYLSMNLRFRHCYLFHSIRFLTTDQDAIERLSPSRLADHAKRDFKYKKGANVHNHVGLRLLHKLSTETGIDCC